MGGMYFFLGVLKGMMMKKYLEGVVVGIEDVECVLVEVDVGGG